MSAARKSVVSARRGLLCSSAIAVGLALGVMGPGSVSAQERTASYDIQGQSLATALREYGRLSGVQIIFSEDLVRGLRAPALRGVYSATDALERLLAGSGLVARRTSTGAVMIVREGSGPQGEGAAAGDSAAARVEDVVVTGSRITGVPPSSPVHTVTRSDIEQAGYGTVGDVIRSLPENFNGGQNPGVVSAPLTLHNNTTNSTTVNLRGLGSDATLALLNGRRLPPDGYGQSADISTIPLAAIQRVEVLTDGSSAIYGSDAIAGVANFILKTRYDGGEVSARVGGATQGGGLEQVYSALVGKTFSRWHALASVEYLNREAIFAHQRDFTATAPGDSNLGRQEERTSAMVSVGADITSRLSFNLDALWAHRRATYTDHYQVALPAYPHQMDLPSHSIAGGFKLALPLEWNLRLDGGASSTDATDISGYLGIEFNYRNETNFVEGLAEGTLLSLPGGAVKVAFGGGHRNERFVSGYTFLGMSRPLAAGSRNIDYLFAELRIPVVSSYDDYGTGGMDLSFSGRIEEYSDFGSSSTPKVGLRYVPIRGLALRGTWGESFKAPSFWQLYTGQSAYLGLASIYGGMGGGTVIQASGGNPNLRPERSTSWTLGAEYEPPKVPGMKIGATYFNIDYTDRVITPISTLTTALTDPAFTDFIIRNPTPAQQAEIIGRAPSLTNGTGATYDPSSVIAIVLRYNANAAAYQVEGVDLSYRQTFNLAKGELSAFANATWIQVKQQTLPTLPLIEISGKIFQVPEFRGRSGLTWKLDGVSATGTVNFQSESIDTGTIPNRSIASLATVDANISYDFPGNGLLAGASLAFSVTNLFDEDPPYAFSPSIYHDGVFFDSTNASPIGRFVAVTVRKSF